MGVSREERPSKHTGHKDLSLPPGRLHTRCPRPLLLTPVWHPPHLSSQSSLSPCLVALPAELVNRIKPSLSAPDPLCSPHTTCCFHLPLFPHPLTPGLPTAPEAAITKTTSALGVTKLQRAISPTAEQRNDARAGGCQDQGQPAIPEVALASGLQRVCSCGVGAAGSGGRGCHRRASQATPLAWTLKAGPGAGEACARPASHGASAVTHSQEKPGFCPNLRKSGLFLPVPAQVHWGNAVSRLAD